MHRILPNICILREYKLNSPIGTLLNRIKSIRPCVHCYRLNILRVPHIDAILLFEVEFQDETNAFWNVRQDSPNSTS